ncbi:MAG: T9SS type A sorting domain-containing protein [Bacteroidota bacterium]
MKFRSLLFFTVFSFHFLQAQSFEYLNVPVTQNNQVLLSPWAGGINAPQWSKVDLDGDGVMDLYAFDRDGFVHLPFLNIGGTGESEYAFASEFIPNFPTVWNFVLLRDFNKDGVMDFFGHSQRRGAAGFEVHRGEIENGELQFDLIENPNWILDVITIPLNNGSIANLNVNNVDYPAIDDIDGDGDLDILSLDATSGRDFNYYRNFALERGFTTDTLIFELEDDCWGRIYLPDQTTTFVLSGDPDTCARDSIYKPLVEDKNGGLHGASTICTFDADNDGDKEVLYGDLNFPQIMEGVNGGHAQSAWITNQDVTFPSYNLPVHMPDFPNSFYLDYDNDGLKDLLFNPNEFNVSPDVEVWFYKNVESNEMPVFDFVKKDAMVDQMIDVGKGSHPVFFDYNSDGLLDIVVGNFERTTTTNAANNKEASLYLYENIGTIEAPAFELVDDDYLGLRQFTTVDPQIATKQYAPAFGDLDQDGDEDALVGEKGGYMFYAENTAGPGNPAIFSAPIPQWKNIRIGNFPTPYIYDLNKDGLADILAGEIGGNINYLPNIGTPGNPDFHDNTNDAPNNQLLGGITTIQSGTPAGYSAPTILELRDTVFLLTGSQSGFIEMYQVDTSKLEFGDTFVLIEKQLNNFRMGTHSRVSFANLNEDESIEAVIGNHRGGISLFVAPFNNTPVSTRGVVNNLEFNIYPNPAKNYVYFEINDLKLRNSTFSLYNTLGQIVINGTIDNGRNKIELNNLQNGTYFLQIRNGDKIGVKKLFVFKK